MEIDTIFVNDDTHSAVATIEVTGLPRSGDFIVVPAWGGDFALVLGVTFGLPGTRPLALLADRRFPISEVVAHLSNTVGLARRDGAWSKSRDIENPFRENSGRATGAG